LNSTRNCKFEEGINNIEICIGISTDKELFPCISNIRDAIRQKHGMDLGSLQRLLLGITAPPVPSPIPAPPAGIMPVPAPSVVPRVDTPAPPAAAVVKSASISPYGPSIYSPFDDDLTARPMSLSSGAGSARSNKKGEISFLKKVPPICVRRNLDLKVIMNDAYSSRAS
jgi:hypothetical protein